MNCIGEFQKRLIKGDIRSLDCSSSVFAHLHKNLMGIQHVGHWLYFAVLHQSPMHVSWLAGFEP